MYDVPESGNVTHVKITRSGVRGETKPIVRRRPDAAAA